MNRNSAINTSRTFSSRLVSHEVVSVIGLILTSFSMNTLQAANSIKELASASEALTTQSNFLLEQQKERRSYLAKLKGRLGVRSQKPTIQMVSKRVAVPQSILDCVPKPPPTAEPASTTVTKTNPMAASQSKESVIVLDDD